MGGRPAGRQEGQREGSDRVALSLTCGMWDENVWGRTGVGVCVGVLTQSRCAQGLQTGSADRGMIHKVPR